MDQETKQITDQLYMRNFELLCPQVKLSARINALREMFLSLVEEAEGELNKPANTYEQIFTRKEKNHFYAILRGYADLDPNLASAIEQRIKSEEA